MSSSTLVTAKFDSKRDNVIKTSVVGNSGYMILRPTTDDDDKWIYEEVYRSKDQYHSNGKSKQVGKGPDFAN